MLKDDFYNLRRTLTPRRTAPEPKGWRPEGTFTGNPPRGIGEDPHDSRPSRNPYPRQMPDLGGPLPIRGPGDIDVHARAMRALDRAVHEDRFLVLGGEVERLPQLQRAILERKAVREELGTGIVLLSDEEQRFLDLGGPPEATAA